MSQNLKITIAIVYSICLAILLYVVFVNIEISSLNDYSYIRENSEELIKFKNDNKNLFIIIFFLFSILWVFFLGFGSPIAIISGFIFGKWLGTIISVLSFTIGSSLLYILVQIYFSQFIIEKFSSRIGKFRDLFNKNELIYFMLFRFAGGGGLPFAVQNVLPVIFNMKIRNYFYSTLLGLIPTVFVINFIGEGIQKFINQNENISMFTAITNPEIYIPILSFFVLLIISFFLKKKFFK